MINEHRQDLEYRLEPGYGAGVTSKLFVSPDICVIIMFASVVGIDHR